MDAKQTVAVVAIALGLLFLLMGLVAPASTEKTDTVCVSYIQTPQGEICETSVETTYDEKNDFKAPMIVVGFAISLVGMGVFGASWSQTGDE